MHCVKSTQIQSFSRVYFPVFGMNTDQKNSVFGNFLYSGVITLKLTRSCLKYIHNCKIQIIFLLLLMQKNIHVVVLAARVTRKIPIALGFYDRKSIFDNKKLCREEMSQAFCAISYFHGCWLCFWIFCSLVKTKYKSMKHDATGELLTRIYLIFGC